MYHGKNRLLICLMDGHRKASSELKISLKVLLLLAMKSTGKNHFVRLSDLAAELEAIAAMLGG